MWNTAGVSGSCGFGLLMPPYYIHYGYNQQRRNHRRRYRAVALLHSIAARRLRRDGWLAALGLVLHLRVEFRTEQDRNGRDPEPGHKADDRAQRTIGLVEGAEARRIPGEQRRGGKPERRG